MLEAFVATMTAALAEGGIGCAAKDAQRKAVKLYSSPRAAGALQAAPSRHQELWAGPHL